jgi:superfamily I DNA/RNA helicase
VDEAQDFHTEEWKLIRALTPAGTNNLFLVGDAHQRIYGSKVSLRTCGINVQGRSSQLKINYRTTEQIRAWAMAVLKGVEVDDLDNERQREQGYKSLLSGALPEYKRCSSMSDEQEFIRQKLKKLLTMRRPEEICLVARTAKLLRENYLPLLKQLDVPHALLEKNQEGEGVRLATMHRVKGLEFPVMILAGVNAEVIPLRLTADQTDSVGLAEHETRERSLLFVAATRARDLLIVSSWGKPSPLLPE